MQDENRWQLEILENVIDSIENLPIGIKVSIYRILELLEKYGNQVGEPHTKSLGNGLFEIRAKGVEGIARAFFTFRKNKMIVVFHCFIKKDNKTPKREIDKAREILKNL